MAIDRRNPGAGRPLAGIPPVPVSRHVASPPPAVGRPAASQRPAAPPARRPAPARPAPARRALSPLLQTVLWWGLVSLAITLVRLAGELRGWSPEYWSRLPGGGLSPLGITWLIPLVGFHLGWRLRKAGQRPSSLVLAAVLPLLVFVLGSGALLAIARMRAGQHMAPLTWTAWLTLWGVVSVLALAVGLFVWAALGRWLLAYALLARIPVAAVMALAMYRRWGTHYDVPPPQFPQMSWLRLWSWTGLLPQLTIWVAITICVGALFGALGWLAAEGVTRLRAR